MKLPVWALTTSGSLALLVNGWDRVTGVAADASDRVRNVAEDFSDRLAKDFGTRGEADYGSLVDLDDDGYRFRRDLPFPGWVMVNESRVLTVESGRVIGDAAAGESSVGWSGKFETRSRVAVGAGRAEWRMERSDFEPTMIQVARERRNGGLPDLMAGLLTTGLDGKTAQFGWDGKNWRAAAKDGRDADFIEGAWALDLQADLPVLLAVSGLMPRSMWFGGRRMAVGDHMGLKGKLVAMLTGYAAEGDVAMTFEKVEELDGHPCGVFLWSGELEARGVPSPDGPRSDLKMDVGEGRTWMSLVYPVVLRSEVRGSREVGVKLGSATARWQGYGREVVERRWRAEN